MSSFNAHRIWYSNIPWYVPFDFQPRYDRDFPMPFNFVLDWTQRPPYRQLLIRSNAYTRRMYKAHIFFPPAGYNVFVAYPSSMSKRQAYRNIAIITRWLMARPRHPTTRRLARSVQRAAIAYNRRPLTLREQLDPSIRRTISLAPPRPLRRAADWFSSPATPPSPALTPSPSPGTPDHVQESRARRHINQLLLLREGLIDAIRGRSLSVRPRSRRRARRSRYF